jgi:hypothetical protein
VTAPGQARRAAGVGRGGGDLDHALMAQNQIRGMPWTGTPSLGEAFGDQLHCHGGGIGVSIERQIKLI